MKSENSSDSESSFDLEVNPDKVSKIISSSYPQMNLHESDLESGQDLVEIVGKCVVCSNIPMDRVMECANCNSLYCDTCLPEKDVKCNEIKNVLICPNCGKNSKHVVKPSFHGDSMQRSKKAMNRFLK